MLQKIRNHFIAGLLVLGPLFLTVVVITYLVRLTDRFIVNPLFHILPFDIDQQFKVIMAKIAIAIIVFFFVGLVGFATERWLFKRLMLTWEALLARIPFFNKIYGSIREIVMAFFGEKKGEFGRVVYVEYPRKGVWTIGFVMNDKTWEVHAKTGKPDLITIFVPKPPNPATGFFIAVPKSELLESDMTVEDGVRLVLSYGSVAPQGK